MGKRADAVIWDMSGIRPTGLWRCTALMLAGPLQVRDLIVEGRWVVKAIRTVTA